MDKRFTHITSGWLQNEMRHELPMASVAPYRDPVVIVGNGPVGVRVAHEIMRRRPDQDLIIYGQETHKPYNRAALSSFLSGDLIWEDLENNIRPEKQSRFREHIDCAVKSINASGRWLIDCKGRVQQYSRLVLATGSRAAIPSIKGTGLSGVFSFRDKDDALSLIKRREKCRHTIVIGGGPLGLEVARAMQLGGAMVTVVENRHHLLSRFLDASSSNFLQAYIESLGIHVYVGDPAATITGNKKVAGVRLESGLTLRGDTVVLATGIASNTQLAESAGLLTRRGVVVNDQLRTDDPYIYAAGECAEHRGEIYGLLGPGLAQAEVVASCVLGEPTAYRGSVTHTQLKGLGKTVEFIGQVSHNDDSGIKSYAFAQDRRSILRKLFVHKGCLIGFASIGEWTDSRRLRSYVEKKRYLMPWHLRNFERSGELWPDKNKHDVRFWPDDAIVCFCQGITKAELKKAIKLGCPGLDALVKKTGAGIICGTCRPLLTQILEQPDTASGKLANRITAASAFLGFGLASLMLLSPWEVAQSVQGWHWSSLWFDGVWKQFSGYSLLVLGMAGLLFSLRKRWPVFSIGATENWRLAHVVLGTSTLFTLIVHTGLRTGINLNLALSGMFLSMAVLGVAIALLGALSRTINDARTQNWIRQANQVHIYLAWPIPVLLLFHVVTVYYF